MCLPIPPPHNICLSRLPDNILHCCTINGDRKSGIRTQNRPVMSRMLSPIKLTSVSTPLSTTGECNYKLFAKIMAYCCGSYQGTAWRSGRSCYRNKTPIRVEGLEPSRYFYQRILSPLRLPISPYPLNIRFPLSHSLTAYSFFLFPNLFLHHH